MLYDILFIDDDFDDQSDSENRGKNARKLFLNLIRDNLRVTYTTGELDDLEKLTEKDLSCVKYIFCDLHLVGIKQDDPYKKINSKLIKIFEELWKKIDSEEITIFLNSNHMDTYGDEGKKNLEEGIKSLSSSNSKIVKIEEVEGKNNLNEETKKELLQSNLNIHIRSLIIAKALDVEKTLDEKLDIDEKFVDVITFGSKSQKLRENFQLDSTSKKQILLLQQIRNKVSHTNNALNEIKGEGGRKEFLKIIKGNEYDREICFENFAELIQYIDSIDRLMESIQKAKKLNA